MKKCMLLLLHCLSLSFLQAQIPENTRINTSLEYAKNGKIVDLIVTLQFKTDTTSRFTIGNLRDWYGTPSIWKSMTALQGKSGTVVSKKNNGDSLEIIPANGEVNFTYTLSFDSSKITNTYSPNVGENHVHLTFCQWMVPLVKRGHVLEYAIHVNKLPENWLLYSSLAGEAHDIVFKRAYEKSFSIVIGAGAFYRQSHLINGNPVNVYIAGSFDIGNKKIAALAYEAVAYQRRLFSDTDFEFYNVALLPREENIAGFSIENMFICHIKKDVPYNKLAWLLSHEMAHKWIGGQIGIKDTTTSFGMRHQWFNEGINDYLAYLILLESGQFTEDQFIDGVNQYLKNIKENPYADASEDSVMRVVKAGKYGTAATKLFYYKGMLMGLIADQLFLDNPESGVQSQMKKFILRLLQKNKIADGYQIVDEATFFSITDSMKIPLRSLYQKHIINGAANFDMPKTLFDRSFQLRKVEYAVYDLGFIFDTKGEQLFAKEVNPNGPAYKAGVRDDMEIISCNNFPRFGNAWCDCLITMVVKVNGEEKKFEYMPHGKKVKVWQYVKR